MVFRNTTGTGNDGNCSLCPSAHPQSIRFGWVPVTFRTSNSKVNVKKPILNANPLQSAPSSPGPQPKRWSWRKRTLVGLALFAILFFLGDFGYSTYVAIQLRQWEAGLQRDEQGVLPESEAYSSGTGTTAILFVHGINESPYAWRKMAPRLSAAGFHCRVMRMPGFAEPLPQYARYGSDDWIQAVRAEVAALRKTHSRVYIMAHSLGGAVTIQSAWREPHLCDGLILLAPAIEVSSARSPILPTRAWHCLAGGLVFTKTVHSSFPNDALDPAEKDPPHRTTFTPRAVLNETFRLIDENRVRQDPFPLPVLLILSHNDRVTNSQAAERYFLDRKGTVEIYWNDQAAHALPYDYGWETIANKSTDFIHRDELNSSTHH